MSLADKVGGIAPAIKKGMEHYLKIAWKRMFFGENQLPADTDPAFKCKIAEYAKAFGFFESPRLGYRASGDDYIIAFSFPMDTTVPVFADLFPEDPKVAAVIERRVNE